MLILYSDQTIGNLMNSASLCVITLVYYHARGLIQSPITHQASELVMEEFGRSAQ